MDGRDPVDDTVDTAVYATKHGVMVLLRTYHCKGRAFR